MQADTPQEWVVEVIEDATGDSVKAIPCPSERSAERVERGMNINLNHDRYHTRIVPPPEGKSHD